eukprot:scaffold6747_cov55-Phaeocystis_antarctica.AAC.1
MCSGVGLSRLSHIANAQPRRLPLHDIRDGVGTAVVAPQTVNQGGRPFVQCDIVPLRRLCEGLVEACFGVGIVFGRRLVCPVAHEKEQVARVCSLMHFIAGAGPHKERTGDAAYARM